MRKKCSDDREKLLKFQAEGREFAKCLRLLEQFIQTVKGRSKFFNIKIFQVVPVVFSQMKTIRIQIGEKNLGFGNMQEKFKKISFFKKW